MSIYDTPPEGTYSAPPNSTMAIISLITGVLGLTFIPFVGSIVAVVTGQMAKKEIQQSAGTLQGEGMATAGLVLGWIGIVLGVPGLCLVGAIVAIPLCLIPFGILSDNVYWLLPSLFAGL